MKKLLVFGLITILVIVALLVIGYVYKKNQSETPVTTFLTYENLDYGIRIEYPQNWEKKEQPREGVIVAFVSPPEGFLVFDILEKLNIIVQDLSAQPMTLSEYTELNLSQLPQLFPDFNVIESSDTILVDYPAYKHVSTFTKDNYKIKSLQIWTIKNNKAYVITYSAEAEKYSKFLETIEEMINSFEIL